MLVGPSSFAVAAAYMARQPNFQALVCDKTWVKYQHYRYCFLMGRDITKRYIHADMEFVTS